MTTKHTNYCSSADLKAEFIVSTDDQPDIVLSPTATGSAKNQSTAFCYKAGLRSVLYIMFACGNTFLTCVMSVYYRSAATALQR